MLLSVAVSVSVIITLPEQTQQYAHRQFAIHWWDWLITLRMRSALLKKNYKEEDMPVLLALQEECFCFHYAVQFINPGLVLSLPLVI